MFISADGQKIYSQWSRVLGFISTIVSAVLGSMLLESTCYARATTSPATMSSMSSMTLSDSRITRQVMRQHLETCPYEDTEWDTDKFSEFLDHVMTTQLNLQQFALVKTSFSILERYQERHTKAHGKTHNIVLEDAAVWKDLNLFCGQKDLNCFFGQSVDRTHTVMGRAVLYTMLAQLQTDIAVLKERQAMIQVLVEDDNLRESLSVRLESIKKMQNILLSFWTRDPFKQAASRKYFNYSSQRLTDTLNNNALILNTRLWFEHFGRCIFSVGTSTVASVLLPLYGINKIVGRGEFPGRIQKLAHDVRGSGGQLFAWAPSLSENEKWLGIVSIASGIVSGLSVKDQVEWAIDNFTIERYMHTKMRTVACVIQELQSIYDVIRTHPRLSSLCVHKNGMRTMRSQKRRSPKLNGLLNGLRSDAITQELSWGTNRGRVLIAFKQFCAIKEELEDALVELGQIDAYVSLAQLYKEHEKSALRFSFAQFEERQEPFILLNNFWNPLIGSDKAVANSIELGVSHKRNIIITGPNAGGKSTIGKSLILAVIMAQSFGMMPADNAVITPFDTIVTYLNVVDDIGAGNSLFKAQVLRTQQIVDKINMTASAMGKSLALFDEMYNGTSPKEAEACAYSVAKIIGAHPGAINIIITHHDFLTRLGFDTNYYDNYCVKVTKRRDGSLSYPFKLQPGISNQNIALDMLYNEGLGNVIVHEARMLLDQKSIENRVS